MTAEASAVLAAAAAALLRELVDARDRRARREGRTRTRSDDRRRAEDD